MCSFSKYLHRFSKYIYKSVLYYMEYRFSCISHLFGSVEFQHSTSRDRCSGRAVVMYPYHLSTLFCSFGPTGCIPVIVVIVRILALQSKFSVEKMPGKVLLLFLFCDSLQANRESDLSHLSCQQKEPYLRFTEVLVLLPTYFKRCCE